MSKLIVDVGTGKFEKKGPKGWNKAAPGGAEDGAPNAKSVEAISTPEPIESRTVPPSQAALDIASRVEGRPMVRTEFPIIEYVKLLTVVEISAFCKKNGITVSDTPANGGVLKMRHLNAVKAALKAGRELQK